MGAVKYNKNTGQAIRLEGGAWVDTPVKRNKTTGDAVAFDGEGWSAVGGGPDFAAASSGMSPRELSVARSKNNAMGEFLRQQASQPKQGETEAETFKRQYGPMPERPGMDEGITRALFQGVTMGFGDELVAGGTAALDAILRGDNLGEAYDVRRAQERSKLEQFREDSPVAAYGSEIGGAIPTVMVPWLNVARGVNLARGIGTMAPWLNVALGGNLARGIWTGALQGGVYGFGAGEGSPLEQAKSTAIGLGVGSAVGALAAPVAAGAGRLVNKLMTDRAAKQVGMTGPQYQILNRAMQSDDALTGGGARRMQAAGPDAMLADTGPGAQTILDTAIQSSPPAARKATEAIERRVGAASRKLQDTMDSTLGTPKGVKTTARGIAQDTSAARSDAYNLAYSKPIDYASDAGREIESVLSRVPSRVMKDAVEKANEKMTYAGVKNQQIMASIADDGTVTFTEMPNVQQLDFIKRALGEMGAEAVDKFGRKTADGTMFSTLARNIKGATSKSVPEYAEAVRLGGDKIERDNALFLGSKLLSPRTTMESVKDFVEDMSIEAKQAAAQGLRSHIDEALAQVKMAMTDTNMDAREAFKLIKDMSSRANREKVGMILGADDAGALFKQLDESAKAFELRASVARNSATAQRQATQQGVKDVVEGGPWNALRQGEVVESPKKMIAAILGRSPEAKQQISDDVYIGLVKALTGPRGAQARAMLDHLQTVQHLIAEKTGGARNLAASLMARNAPVSAPVTGRLTEELQRRNR